MKKKSLRLGFVILCVLGVVGEGHATPPDVFLNIFSQNLRDYTVAPTQTSLIIKLIQPPHPLRPLNEYHYSIRRESPNCFSGFVFNGKRCIASLPCYLRNDGSLDCYFFNTWVSVIENREDFFVIVASAPRAGNDWSRVSDVYRSPVLSIQTLLDASHTCPAGQIYSEETGECLPFRLPAPTGCPLGRARNEAGECVLVRWLGPCQPGEMRNENGICIPEEEPVVCAFGQEANEAGECVPPPEIFCLEGQVLDESGACVDTQTQIDEEPNRFKCAGVVCRTGTACQQTTGLCVSIKQNPLPDENDSNAPSRGSSSGCSLSANPASLDFVSILFGLGLLFYLVYRREVGQLRSRPRCLASTVGAGGFEPPAS